MSDGRTEEAAWYSLAVGAFTGDRRLSDDDDNDEAVRRKSCEQGIVQPKYEYALAGYRKDEDLVWQPVKSLTTSSAGSRELSASSRLASPTLT
jgi:hypothetical protein